MTNVAVSFNRSGQIKAWRETLNGVIEDLYGEGLTNTFEYAFPSNFSIPQNQRQSKILIYKLGESDYVLGLIDNGIGIENQYWQSFCSEVYVHLNPNGIVNKYGEGIKKAALSISKDGMFVITKSPNDYQARTAYLYFDNSGDFRSDDSVIPKWLQTINYLPFQTGTAVWVLLKTKPDMASSEKYIKEKFNRSDVSIDLFGKILTKINYGEQSIKQHCFTKDILCPKCQYIHKINIDITAFREITYDLKGWIRFFVNGIEVWRTRPKGMGANTFEVNITSLPHIQDYIRNNKKDLAQECKDAFLNPIVAFLVSEYQKLSNDKENEIANHVAQLLQKKGGRRRVKPPPPTTKHKDPDYLWWCPKCEKPFLSDKKANFICPLCGTVAEFMLQYKRNPSKKNNNIFEIRFEHLGQDKDFAVPVEPILFINYDHAYYPIYRELRGKAKQKTLTAYASIMFGFWQNDAIKNDRQFIDQKICELKALTEDNMKVDKDEGDD